jgi:hypothetical protein
MFLRQIISTILACPEHAPVISDAGTEHVTYALDLLHWRTYGHIIELFRETNNRNPENNEEIFSFFDTLLNRELDKVERGLHMTSQISTPSEDASASDQDGPMLLMTFHAKARDITIN